jgi:radical SAM superfamily enzyme YgiQ (UPF0313 family)
MKILLVVKSMAIENLGPMYLSAVAKKAGHECRITELVDALTQVIQWEPNVVGCSIMTGDQEKFRSFVHQAKHFGVTFLYGGPHITFFPKDFKDEPGIMVPGEAEDTFSLLLESPNRFPSIDSIPWPDRTDFPGMRIRDFIASRGCPHSCGYCYNSAWKKMFPELPLVRTRRAADVVDEVARVEPEFAYFQDSCFGVSIRWMREFVKEYRRKANIPYHCHLRPGMVTEERAVMLHDSNCVSVKIALETASNRLRTLINRGKSNNEEVYIASRHLKKWEIKLILQNILGLPESSIEDDLETLEVNIKSRPAYSWCSIFQPYPGTVLGDMCKEKGYYRGDYSEISDSFFDTSVLEFDDEHKEQIVCLQRIFALCVEMKYLPKVEELTIANLPKLVHKIMRQVGDQRMFPGIL